MATMADVIEKLIQLALHNPNEEEAKAAALKAVTLIDKFSIPIGANISPLRDVEDWKPPTPEEMSTINDLLGKKKGASAKEWAGQHHEGKAEGLVTQDNTPITGQDAFRMRLVDAWRSLREERQRMEAEVQRYERETGRKFWGDGLHTRGW